MKLPLSLVIVFFPLIILSQNIREISVHPCTDCSYEKHIYALGDTAVYWYNWYYYYYSPYPNTGLATNNGVVQIDELETYEDDDFDSRLYVISDTAVFYYISYYQHWYPISTDGLNRVNGKPDLHSLQVFMDMDEDVRVYVVSNDSIMFYDWYYARWYPLTNPILYIGEVSNNNNPDLEINCSVADDILNLEIEFPENVHENFYIDIYDIGGRKYNRTVESDSAQGKIGKQISIRNLVPGVYILVLKSDSYYKKIKFVKP